MELVKETRAKVGYIEGQRVRKDGSIVRTKQQIVASEGMHSTKEMEQVMIQVAKDVGAPEDAIRIESYAHGAAPIEANPRHRGRQPSLTRRSDSIQEISNQNNKPSRRVWGGWSPS